MKAAIVTAAGKTPVYGEFSTPNPAPGEELIAVRAAALSNLTKSRASGAHYSSAGLFPAVAGTDGVGRTQSGRRVYFAMPDGAWKSRTRSMTLRQPRLQTPGCPRGLPSLNAHAWQREKPFWSMEQPEQRAE